MKKHVLSEELSKIKSLFVPRKGKIISEQASKLGGFGLNPNQAVADNTYVKKQIQPPLQPANPNQLPLYSTFAQQPPLVNCAGVTTYPMDTPTSAQQTDFAQKSGLNPKVDANKQFFCSLNKMSAKLSEINKKPLTQKKQPNDIAQKFSKTANSLGIKNAKMDVQTLQIMLDKLEGKEPTNDKVQNTNITTDIAKLNSMLQQLGGQ